MPINPKDMVDYAFDLYSECEGIPDNELRLRIVINRAYYGAFLVARDFAGVKNTKKSSIHQKVINHYKKNRILQVSMGLDFLRKLRGKADYGPNETVSEWEAEASYRTAQNVIAKIKELPLLNRYKL